MSRPRPLGRSAAHQQLLEKLSKASSTSVEVLISGPSGVGKELYAGFVHENGPRSGRRFVPVDCGVLPVALFENEMFGHVGGAFTSAKASADGLVAEADGGTLFLDEVDALEPANQVKLLRLIQEREYRRLGDPRIRRADVRIIAATNRDLLREVHEGRFREDLLFRLRVFPVDVPPLRTRPEDIEVLLQEFVMRSAEAYGLPPVEFTPAALERLFDYSWPGNVRELENCVRYLTCVGIAGSVGPGDLPLLSQDESGHGPERTKNPLDKTFQEAKREAIETFELNYLEAALASAGGKVTVAARASGKHRRAFFELMRKHGLRAERFCPSNGGYVRSGLNGAGE